jgi:hypothetical protein
MRRQLTPQRSDVGMLASVALAKLALHLLLSGRYGYWIDELYFLMRMTITVCRGLKVPIGEFWPKVKCWTCDRPAFMRPPPVPARSADASP